MHFVLPPIHAVALMDTLDQLANNFCVIKLTSANMDRNVLPQILAIALTVVIMEIPAPNLTATPIRAFLEIALHPILAIAMTDILVEAVPSSTAVILV